MNKKWLFGILICLISLLFLFLRFYNINQRFAFAWDQENIANEVYKLLVEKKPSLIGPRANNDLGFYLGPYFTYMISPLFALTHLHPNAMILFVLLIALIFIGLSFGIITSIFSLSTALIFLAVWGVNPYLIQLDMTAWWPVVIPSGSLLFLLLMSKITSIRRSSYLFLLGLLCGFFSNMHFQFVFITLAAISLILLEKISVKKKVLSICIFAGAFAITLIPLFFFDIRHNFLNLTLFFNFFFGKSHSQIGSNLFAFLPVFLNVVKTFLPINNTIILSIFGVGILVSPFFLAKLQKTKREKNMWLTIFILNSITILGFMAYGKRPSEYYFLFLIPFFVLTLCRLGLLNTYTKIAMTIFIVWGILINRNIYVKMLTRPAYAYMALKEKTILEIKKYSKARNINVTFDVPAGDNNGYRYFMKLHSVKESGDWNDPLIEVQIPPQKGNIIMSADIGIKMPLELKQ